MNLVKLKIDFMWTKLNLFNVCGTKSNSIKQSRILCNKIEFANKINNAPHDTPHTMLCSLNTQKVYQVTVSAPSGSYHLMFCYNWTASRGTDN